MPLLAVENALLACDKGSLLSPLGVMSTAPPVNATKKLAAEIEDWKPAINVRSFGMCSSMENPEVQAATEENKGVLTPMPCSPKTTTNWSGKTIVTIRNVPALHEGCTVSCQYGGTITFK